MRKMIQFFPLFLLVLCVSAFGQNKQVLGSFPEMDGGFEGQTVGTTTSATTVTSQTVWTNVGGTPGNVGTIYSTGGRSGPKYASLTMTASGTAHRRFQSPTTTNSGAITSGSSYTVQFYWKRHSGTTTTTFNIRGGVSNSGSAGSVYSSYNSVNSDSWTLYQGTVTTSGGTSAYGMGIISLQANSNASGGADYEDFCVYAGAIDNTAPDQPGSITVTGTTNSSISLSWSAPGTGVDGGGYMIVRSTSDPTSAPNAHGMYAVGNKAPTEAGGTGSGTVVALQTGTTYSDTLSSTGTYYYRIYTVDKAFNYSTPQTISATTGSVAPTTQCSGIGFSTVTSSTMTVSWTRGNGSNVALFMKAGSGSITNPSDGSSYTASSNWNNGSPSGTQLGSSGYYCIYNGSGTSLGLTNLDPSTTYYLYGYEYNGTGSNTAYLTTSPASGNQATQAAASPTITVNGTLTDFGNVALGNASAAQSYTVSGVNLTAAISITPPTGFEVSTSNSPFSAQNPLSLSPSGGSVGTTTIYVRFNPASADGGHSGNITNTSSGATTMNVAAAGNALAAEPTTQSSLSFGTVGQNSVVVNFTGGNGGHRILVASPGSAVTFAPSDAAAISGSNSDFSLATDQGSGNKVVYDGTGSTVTVTGLAGATTYYFAIYEYNTGTGTSENYLAVSPGTGNATTTQPTYTWNATGTASWATAANWTPARSTPGSTDILVFNNGASDTVTNVPTQTISQLTVNGTTTVYLQSAATATLTVAGGPGTDLSVAAGSALNISSGTTLTLALSTGATASISGNMTFSGAAHKLTSPDASGITFQNGSVFTAGTGFSSNAFGATTANSVVFASGSMYYFVAGSNPFALTAPSSVVVFQTGSTYKHTTSSTPSMAGRTYANFEYAYTGTMTLQGSSNNPTFSDIIVDLGTLNFDYTAGVVVKGNINVASGATLTFGNAANNTNVTFNGPSAQSITNAGTLTFGSTSTLTLNNANGLTLNNSQLLSGALTLTNGLFTVNGCVLTLSSATAIGGTPSASNMIVTTNDGSVKKILTGAVPHSFTFPVGDNTGTAEYSPVTYTLNSGTFTAETVGIAVSNSKNSNISESSNYLDRYWTLTSDGVTNPSYDAVFTYLPADVIGTESALSGGLYNGASWTNLGAVNTSVHTFTASAQSAAGVFSAKAFLASGDVTVKVIPQGFYNAAGYLNGTDTIRVLLADASTPYAVVDSADVVLDSLTFSATATFSSAASGSYYLVIKHRNSVETWSASGVSFTKGSTTNYDFTTAATQAYGSNEVEVATGVFAIYSGDCNQDGYVDPLDLSLVDQDSFNYVSGMALATDVNGDKYVDPLDLSIVDQNSFNYVGIQRPAAAKMMSAKERAKTLPYYQNWLNKKPVK